MSLWLKIAGGVFLVAAVVAVAIFALGIGNVRSPQLTSSVKPGEERTSSGSQSGADSAKQNWQVSCKGDRELRCLATQSVLGKKTGRVVLSAEVRPARGTNQPVLLLKLPLNIYLPEGVRLRIGGGPVKGLKIQTCTPQGCMAASHIGEDELAAMLKGEKLTVSVKDGYSKTPIKYQISGGGFDKAYAKLN